MTDYLFRGLAHIGLEAANPKSCAEFYAKNLDFIHLHSQSYGNSTIEFVGCGSCVLEIIPAENDGKSHGQLNHFAIEVLDVDAAFLRLQQAGVLLETEKPIVLEDFFCHGIKIAFFRGPTGERVEIFQYLN